MSYSVYNNNSWIFASAVPSASRAVRNAYIEFFISFGMGVCGPANPFTYAKREEAMRRILFKNQTPTVEVMQKIMMEE